MRPTLLFAAVLAACAPPPPSDPGPPPPVPVSVVTARPRDLPRPLEYLAHTASSREVEVRARVSGFLDRRAFVEGAIVKAGDLLFEIDRRPLQAQADIAAAEVEVAEARWANAKREAARLEPLLADRAISERERDEARSAEQTAAAELASARARLRQADLDLQYTRVTAPIAGKIGRALRPEGSLVTSGPEGLLTTLLQLDPIYVEFHRTETQQMALDAELASGRVELPPDGRLQVEVRTRDGELLGSGGVIDYVAGRVDPATGTIPMRATLPNPDLRLRAGQAVRAVLVGARRRGAIAVPQRAVIEGPRGKLVMLAVAGAGGDVAESRAVEVGDWVRLPGEGPLAEAWVVEHGLAAGDRVIVDNLMRLRPGAPVRAEEATDPGGAADPGRSGK